MNITSKVTQVKKKLDFQNFHSSDLTNLFLLDQMEPMQYVCVQFTKNVKLTCHDAKLEKLYKVLCIIAALLKYSAVHLAQLASLVLETNTLVLENCTTVKQHSLTNK